MDELLKTIWGKLPTIKMIYNKYRGMNMNIFIYEYIQSTSIKVCVCVCFFVSRSVLPYHFFSYLFLRYGSLKFIS